MFVASWSQLRVLCHRYAQADSRLFSLSVWDSKGSGQTQTKIHLNLAKRGTQETKENIAERSVVERVRGGCRKEDCKHNRVPDGQCKSTRCYLLNLFGI